MTHNITADHVGKHGTLTLGDSVIVGEITDARPDYVGIRPDGARWVNAVEPNDGWTFTPDPNTVPTTPGVYIVDQADVFNLNGIYPGDVFVLAQAGSGSATTTWRKAATFYDFEPAPERPFGHVYLSQKTVWSPEAFVAAKAVLSPLFTN